MSLSSNLNKLKGRKILVVGDVGLDEYVNGEVRRISPEAPVPIVEVAQREGRLGLATNVAQNIVSLGGECALVSVIGDDVAGAELCKLLEEARVSTGSLIKDNSRPTTQKLRVMSEHHHLVRVDFEQRRFVAESVENEILRKVDEGLPEVDGVILQDYAKGVISRSLSQKIISLSKKHGKTIMVDPNKVTPLEFFVGADLMTPNFDEALALSGLPPNTLHTTADKVEEIGKIIMEKIQSDRLVITQGKDGMCLFEDGRSELVPTFAQDVYDVTGAGDTVIAALSLSFAAGLSLRDSCLIANHAAGIVVGKVGCVPCHFEELRSNLQRANL